MTVLLWGSGMFLAALAVHFFVWRVRLPIKPISTLMGIFLVLYGAAAVVYGAWSFQPSYPSNFKIIDWLFVSAIYAPMSISYVLSYTAIEGESPSALIVLALENVGRCGLRRDDFQRIITDDLFVRTRIRGLTDAGWLASSASHRYVITNKGRFFLWLFTRPRRLMAFTKALPERQFSKGG